MTGVHRRQTVTLVPAAVQRTFVLGVLAHMLGDVDRDEIAALPAAPRASTAERLRKGGRDRQATPNPGVDPAEDIAQHPYGRSNSRLRCQLHGRSRPRWSR